MSRLLIALCLAMAVVAMANASPVDEPANHVNVAANNEQKKEEVPVPKDEAERQKDTDADETEDAERLLTTTEAVVEKVEETQMAKEEVPTKPEEKKHQ